MNNIGIRQGLISKTDHFPYKNWKYEFDVAKQIGIDCVEWLIDSEPFCAAYSPFLSEERSQEIEEITNTTGIKIATINAIAFEEYSLIKFSNPSKLQRRIDQLEYFIKLCNLNNVRNITIPLISDKSQIDIDISNIAFALKVASKTFEPFKININISSNLQPHLLNDLILKAQNEYVGIDYYLKGKNIDKFEEVISQIGVNINVLHIDDNISIDNFKECYEMLKKVCFDGPIIISKCKNIQHIKILRDKIKKAMK